MVNFQNLFSYSVPSPDSEKENFQAALQEFSQQMHGGETIQLVVNVTPSQTAYEHFLAIGSRDFSNSSQRWNTILRELSAEEFVRILPFIRNANYDVGLQKGETYV